MMVPVIGGGLARAARSRAMAPTHALTHDIEWQVVG